MESQSNSPTRKNGKEEKELDNTEKRERSRSESNHKRKERKKRVSRRSRSHERKHARKRHYSSSRSSSVDRRKNKRREYSREDRRGRTHDQLNPGNNVYVSNLSRRVRDQDLEEKFSKYGKIIDVRIVADPFTKESRGFGFVTFESNLDADDAIDALNGLEYEGKPMRVEKARRSRPHESTPGKYCGPAGASSKYTSKHSHSPRDRRSRRDRSRSPRYSPYKKSESRSRSRSHSRGNRKKRTLS